MLALAAPQTPADEHSPGQQAQQAQDEPAEQEPADQAQGGALIFGERLMHYRRDEDGHGSGRFQPPLPVDDKVLLLSAMKSLARATYGIHGIDVEDPDAFDPRIGRVIVLEDLDYDYRFMLDGSVTGGVRVILVQRRETERVIDEEALLRELEDL